MSTGMHLEQTQPAPVLSPAAEISQRVLAWRWPLMLSVALLAAFLIVADHQPLSAHRNDPRFLAEIFLFVFVLPVLGGSLLTVLRRSEGERQQAVARLDVRQALSHSLSQAASPTDLLEQVVRYPGGFPSVVAASLHLRTTPQDAFEQGPLWTRPGALLPPLPLRITPHSCPECLHSAGITPCIQRGATVGLYCLPLRHAGQTNALLHIQFAPEMTISSALLHTLQAAAPELALAVTNAQLQRSVQATAAEASADRRRIAQTLHDTLGQDLSYLRLKLDQLTGEDALWEISLVKEDLERMRQVAEDAYTQVRRTLTELHPAASTDLAMALLQFAREKGARAGFNVQLTSQGMPRPLPVAIKSQVLFITHEALTNIEKHAQAAQVILHLEWGPDNLEIEIQDDGVGFSPEPPREGHFGLQIMQERAAEIGAQLSLYSTPGQGTALRLCLPKV